MFRRSRFSIRPNVSTAGRTAATPQEAPSAHQEATETPRDNSESKGATAVTDNNSTVAPVEQTTGSGNAGDQNGDGGNPLAAVQRRKRFSVKPKVAPGRPATLARKSPVKASSETPVEVSESDVDKPATSSHISCTSAPQGLQSPRRRRCSEDNKQSKMQPKVTPISSDRSASSTVPSSDDSTLQTNLLAYSGKHLGGTSGSQIKEIPPRPPDRVPPIIPDKEVIELSEKAKTLVSSKSGLSLSPSAMSLTRLLNDPSDLQRLAKAQKLRQLLKEERHKEKKLKKAKARQKEYTLDPAKMTMRDLIRYLPMSNPMTSSLEHSTQENETVVPASPEREDRSPERAQVPEVLPKIGNSREEENEEAEEDQEDALMVPQVKVAEDGSLIIDEESLTVEVQRAKGPNPAQDRDPIFERGSTTTYSSFRTSTCPKPWSSEETDMFFLAISMVGTDFSMICQLFPHRARSEIKSKFKREERVNSWRVDKAFRERRRLDIEYFSKLLEKIMEFQKSKKKLKSLAEKNFPNKQKKKKTKGRKTARKLSCVEEEEEEDEEDENEVPDLDEEEGEKENEHLCNEGGTSASKPQRQGKRKIKQDPSNEEPNNKKMSEKSSDQGEASIPEDSDAAPQDPTNSDVFEKTENTTATKDTAVKPATLSRGKAPKPLLPLGRKWGKKAPSPPTTAKDPVSDGASKEQESKDGSTLKEGSKRISDNDEISSEEEEAVLHAPRPTRYGRVPKPTKLLTCSSKEETKCSESDDPPTSPNRNPASAAKPKPKCKAKRGRPSNPQSDQESKKPRLITLRASQSDFSDEENEEEWGIMEEQDPACSLSNDGSPPAFVPASLRSPHPIISVVEETMEELDILENMPDVLSISQDALSPDASCEQAQNEMGTAEPCEHQLDLLVDVIDFLSSEHTEVSEDESYNEAAQTLLTISNLTPLSHLTQNQMASQDHQTETISNIETSQYLEGEIPSNPAARKQSAAPCTSEVVSTVDVQNCTVNNGNVAVVKTKISNEQRSGFDMNHNLQLQSGPESSKKMSPQTGRSNASAVKPKPELGQPSMTTQPKSQPQTSTVTEFVPNEGSSEIPESTPASVKDDIFCGKDGQTEEPSGSQDTSLINIESGVLKYQNVSGNQSQSFSDSNFVPSLEQAKSLPACKDGKYIYHTEKMESGSTKPVTSDISATAPQAEHGSHADSVLVQEDSQNSAAVDLSVSKEPVSDVASACQSKRTRLQKVKPKPNLLQISRTAQPKSHITKNTTDTESSTTQIPESNKRTIAVVEPKQACFTSPVKTNPPAPDCLPSLGLDFTVKKNTDVGLFGQEDSGAATSGQSAIENLNLSEDQLKSSREQARTQTDSKSESTDEKTMSEVIVSGSNPATPERSVPEPQVEQWSSTDSAPVKENSSLSASFVTHVEDLPVSLQAESKAADACQPRRSRLPKVKTKPNLPQASRTARCKPQINKDSINKDSSPAPIPKFTPPEKTTRSTVPTSCLKPPFYLGSSLTQTEESSTTEGKTTDVFGQEDSGATSSGQRASESQKLFTVQFQPSKQQTRGVTTSESIECSTMNPVSADSAVTESVVGQGSNKESGPAKEDGDHSVAHVRPVVELADSQTIEDEAASTCQSKISSLQKVKPKPNLPQTTRKTLPELQSTEDPMMQKPSSSASHSEFSDHPTAEVEAQPTCSTSLAETSSVSLLSLELVTHDEELSSTEGQKTDVEVGIHSSSESSETNVPQRRRRFPKVKPKPNLTSSIRTTRSNLQPKDIKLEKPQINKPVDINSARAELEPEKHDMRSINCPLKTQLLTSSAFPEMSLESTNDMGASSDMIATSGIDNQSMLTDSVPEIKNGENFTEEKTLCNDKVEGEPALKGDCKLDMPTRVTERNTQPTDHPTAISNVHSSEVVLTSKADPTESSHPSCPVSYSEGQSQDVAQQCSEISKNNQTSNDNSPSANRTDESQSESTDSSSSLRKASSTRRGRLKPRPKLGRSTQPPRRQQVQSTSQVEAESCSHIVDTSVSQPESELRPEVQEPVEGAVIQHIGQDSPLEDSGSSLSCLTKITSIQSTSTSSQEGTQNHPGLSIFPGLLSQQVPSDPDEPFFILSLTEIPVCSSGEVVDRAVEPLSYLPLTDASIQQQRCVPGESLAAAEDGSRSEVPVPRSTEESVEMSLINVNDIELDLTTHMGSIVKNPVDAHEGTTVQSATFSENVDNNEVESTTAKQKLTGTRGRAKLQVKSRGARQTKGSKTLTRNTIQDLHHHHGPSVQPEVSDASDEVVTEPQKGSGDQAEIKEETQTHKRDSCSAAPTRMSSSRSRNPKDFLPENNSTAASSDHARGKAVSKSSRAAGEPSSTTLRDVPGTPSRTQTPHATHSELSTMSPTQTEVEVRQTPMPSTSQCTAEVSAFQQSDDSIEEPTSISQYFLSDIFTDVEEG
ncbi:transcription factor TFIIIB component B'' homolog isoform X1 [Channa argus]|uniref:transcription factor TFIIIB component B'' homolog isoform X1 n=1 Tax=Channa argus TaxID=215402 RepID=UPI003522B18B